MLRRALLTGWLLISVLIAGWETQRARADAAAARPIGLWVVDAAHPDQPRWLLLSPGSTAADALAMLGWPDQGVHLVLNGQPWSSDRPLSPTEGALALTVRRGTTLSLQVDRATLAVTTTAASLVAALWDAGETLRVNDRLSAAPATPPWLAPPKVTLRRARPVPVTAHDATLNLYTTAHTVGGALLTGVLAPQGLEQTSPADDRTLPRGKPIVWQSVHEKIVLRQVPVAFSSKTQPLPDAPLDTLKVVQQGQYGLAAQEIRVRYAGEEEIGRRVEASWVVKPPQPRIVGYGTKIVPQTMQTPNGPVTCWRILRVYATSYSPCRLGVDRCSHVTFSGAKLQKGIVAVKRSWYGYMAGQKVYVPGYGFGVIADIGGGIPGRYWIDLGYSDDDYQSWHQWTTLCFVAPPPPAEKIPWILP